jgi:tetratricopeptide (TPR) repeat protein
LIKAADGYHLWSETYDRTLDDIFVVQDDIAGEVVKALKLTLLGTALTARSKPQDPEAYNLALQGRFFLDRRGQQDIERSVDYFRQALERDPDYAPAWAGLSEAYALQADSGFIPVADGYRQAREAAEKALRDTLALDPGLQEARLRLGKLLLDVGRAVEAESLLAEVDERAADARQRYLARLFLGRVAERLGRPEEALRLYRLALEAWPDSQAARLALAHALERSSGPAAPLVLVGATLGASRRPDRAKDPWWLYLAGPLELTRALLERVWARALDP